MKLGYYVGKALSLPPHIVIKKLVSRVSERREQRRVRMVDSRQTTFALQSSVKPGALNCYTTPLSQALFPFYAQQVLASTVHYLNHRYDLLGSGWVEIAHGMHCHGVEGHRYDMGTSVKPDSEGRWLNGRINPANLKESQRIWALVDHDYTPIDWHFDFKSGYRWSENVLSQEVRYGHNPGVDIKVPWELARGQHLPQLALAYALAKNREAGFEPPDIYAREFRNQVLDFVAANPPRYGVNWVCTMDIGIRVANWLVAYDLFRAHGMGFDDDFNTIFARSVYEHGTHIINNLEWSQELRSNHYLSDIVGLLFAAAYLPRTPETDAWLAFATQELIKEVGSQFQEDGSNFEASTSYHRLSAELVVYATALVVGLPQEKQEALKRYDYTLVKVSPKLQPAPLVLHPVGNTERSTPFPAWYFERLERMAEFTMDISSGGRIAQIGDNDSGRFLKLVPAYRHMSVAEAKADYLNLEGYDGLSGDDMYLLEDQLDHRHLVGAINGLFGRDDFAGHAGREHPETYIVSGLAKGIRLRSYREDDTGIDGALTGHGENTSDDIVQLSAYRDFGLYVYKTEHLHLAVRCGHNGQNGNGGHAHNDQLSFELHVDGAPFIIDPGTYLYTPAPEKRNAFRSTAMHNTLAIPGREQNTWFDGPLGLFSMQDKAKARVVEFSDTVFVGEHSGFGPVHRRSIKLYAGSVEAVDECDVAGEKIVSFNLAPGVMAQISNDAGVALLSHMGVHIRLRGEAGTWVLGESFYSAGYGVLQASNVLRLMSNDKLITWKIELGES